jgi:hypothetical protein
MRGMRLTTFAVAGMAILLPVAVPAQARSSADLFLLQNDALNDQAGFAELRLDVLHRCGQALRSSGALFSQAGEVNDVSLELFSEIRRHGPTSSRCRKPGRRAIG